MFGCQACNVGTSKEITFVKLHLAASDCFAAGSPTLRDMVNINEFIALSGMFVSGTMPVCFFHGPSPRFKY